MRHIKEKIIIFGASKLGEDVLFRLEKEKINIAAYVDNNSKKWGMKLHTKIIISPAEISKYSDVKIIIASTYINEIMKQLNELGYKRDQDYFTIPSFLNIIKPLKLKENNTELKGNNIILTYPDGRGMGGIQIWNKMLTKQLTIAEKLLYHLDLGANVPDDKKVIQIQNEKMWIQFTYNTDYYHKLSILFKKLTELLPLTIIQNGSLEVFYLAEILKNKYPDKVRVISIIHTDMDVISDLNIEYQQTIDHFVAVSDEISAKLAQNIPKEKIVTLISPVEATKFDEKKGIRDKKIKIGFVGRLEKSIKRADLLLEFIKRIDKLTDRIEVHIVGNGGYYEEIKEYIMSQGELTQAVLHGYIPHEEIDTFWKDKHFYLNTSDIEGTSLAMLEAMSNGVVPIVTDVSGVGRFVDNNNGKVFEKGNVEDAIEKMMMIIREPETWKMYSENSYHKILEHCSIEQYMQKLLKMIDGEEV